MSAQQFHDEVMAELEQQETLWVCSYCGREATGEPCTFICCGEIGHVEEVYANTGEPVEGKQ